MIANHGGGHERALFWFVAEENIKNKGSLTNLFFVSWRATVQKDERQLASALPLLQQPKTIMDGNSSTQCQGSARIAKYYYTACPAFRCVQSRNQLETRPENIFEFKNEAAPGNVSASS